MCQGRGNDPFPLLPRALSPAGKSVERGTALPARCGLDIVIIELTLDRHTDEVVARLGAELAALPEVLEAYVISGEYDYLVKVAVDGTAGYKRFLREELYRFPGIRHSRSMFASRCMKSVPSVQI